MSIDGNFKFYKGRTLFELNRDDVTTDDRVTIKVTNSQGERNYTKFLPSFMEKLTVDLTPYCKAHIIGNLRDMLQEGEGEGLWYDMSVWVNIPEASYGTLVDGYNPEDFGILTNLPYLQISQADGDIDPIELIIRIPDDADVEICTDRGCYQLRQDGNYDLIHNRIIGGGGFVQLNDISGNYGEDELKNMYLPVRTVPRGMNTRRLIWRNELGGVDAWSFEFLRESNFTTTSDVFYSTLKGYTRANRQYERVNIVETREVDDRVADALAYITASPEVYLYDYERDDYIPIDIVTEECRTYSDTELTSIQIAYRPKEREVL